MIVAGAGGHAIELLDILINNQQTKNMVFYDIVSAGNLYKVLVENESCRLC